MANYNTFVVLDCKKRKPILVTSSARKANKFLKTGIRIEIWNENEKLETIYESTKRREKYPLKPYIDMEKEHIKRKQEKAEEKNKRRKTHGLRYEN